MRKDLVGQFEGNDVWLFTGIPGQEVLWCKGQKGLVSAFNPILRKESTEAMFNSESLIKDTGSHVSVGCLMDTKEQFNKIAVEVKKTIKRNYE
jgi:hypothetical protein